MRFMTITLLSLALPSALALPTLNTRAAARTFAELTISNGTAGNALAEATAKFPVPADLASVPSADLKTLQAERVTAEDAETKAFNPAIKAATDSATKTALQNGKIKNKVLKLFAEVQALQIQKAQGANNQAKIDQETTKLNNNIALDKKAAGQAAQTVTFTGK
ncbi:hypothetical protein TMatcc_002409 [Talaromyces marneffei ATCC 18224]|uniref:Small secreted protein n=2 Tax=Talaromyces marneffei TaxID=37727 RepID=B6QJX1_TALMQ|nr:uncharacterized protein EYB26_006448 [Talaromyces marneffei]EEA23529.1 conserved hypothetical protein [Talaromyces marneffei ATCC 18224]KAE8552365.1 hypothetical protein EYB25_006259 [Talaromyces marneffei]QGA18763.1 hypothetical protein EYB26_006448 [Talaromyces marneffei]